MIFIIITINNVMIIITLCPEATSSCNRCFFNVRCPCQPPHRTGTSGTRLPHHHQATWHVPGPGDTCLGHVACAGRGVSGLDWTVFYSVLLCSALIHLLLPRTSVGGTQPPPPPPSWPGQHQTYGGHQPSSLHYQAANTLDQCPPAPPPWCRCGQSLPLYLYSISVNTQHCPAACHHHHQPGGQKVD